MYFKLENHHLFNKISPLLDWWLAGILIIYYILLKYVFGIDGELLEWSTYIFAGIIALLIFLLKYVEYSFHNNLAKLILSLPLYILILYDLSFSNAHIVFVIASFILLYYRHIIGAVNTFSFTNIIYFVFYFLLFHFCSKLVYWNNFENFIWIKVSETSKYFKYSEVIEKYSPIIVLVVLFSSLMLIISSLKYNFKAPLIDKYWWLIPGIVFAAESFSTSRFFLKQAGGAMYHWQPYVGVIEMMEQGGLLLWDTPSTYGFLSLIVPYVLPFGDAWQKIYIANGSLHLIMGLIIMKTIWNNRGFIWYIVSFGMTTALVYYLPGGENLNNTAEVPSGGGMRYICVVIIMYVLVNVRQASFKSQVKIITPLCIVGILWSIESAFFVSVVLGPYFLFHLFFNREIIFENIKYLFVIPASLFITIALISSLYIFKLGHLPDYYAFAEEAINNTKGFFSEPFTLNSPLWIHIIILSWLLSKIYYKQKDVHILFSIWAGIWAVTSYCIGQSVGIGLLKLLAIYIFGLCLSLKVIDEKEENKLLYNFIPLFVIIITITFGNPKIVRHLYDTITNQDYDLSHVSHKEIDDFHQLLTIINPGHTPVVYIDETRYLNFLSKRKYFNNNNEIIPLSDQIWLPLHPTSLLHGKPYDRQILYINRWMNRHPVEKGWFVRPSDHGAHTYYKKALDKELSKNYLVKKSINHGVLKADLYEKKD